METRQLGIPVTYIDQVTAFAPDLVWDRNEVAPFLHAFDSIRFGQPTTAAPAAPQSRETMVYVVPSLRGEDLGCPDCSLGSTLNMNPIFEPLIYRDLETGEIVPDVGRMAESWSVNDDFSEYTFTLRQGIQFHGGWGELTTDDVAFSFELMTREGTTNPGASMFGKLDIEVDGPYDQDGAALGELET